MLLLLLDQTVQNNQVYVSIASDSLVSFKHTTQLKSEKILGHASYCLCHIYIAKLPQLKTKKEKRLTDLRFQNHKRSASCISFTGGPKGGGSQVSIREKSLQIVRLAVLMSNIFLFSFLMYFTYPWYPQEGSDFIAACKWVRRRRKTREN